jgi:hypothetical protein
VSGSRTPNFCSRPRSAPRWTPPKSGRDLRRASLWCPAWTHWRGRRASATLLRLRAVGGWCAGRADIAASWPQRYDGHRARIPAPAAACASERCDSDGPAIQSPRRKRVAVSRVTQFVTQQPWCEAQDGRDSLIWLGGALGTRTPDLFYAIDSRPVWWAGAEAGDRSPGSIVDRDCASGLVSSLVISVVVSRSTRCEGCAWRETASVGAVLVHPDHGHDVAGAPLGHLAASTAGSSELALPRGDRFKPDDLRRACPAGPYQAHRPDVCKRREPGACA